MKNNEMNMLILTTTRQAELKFSAILSAIRWPFS